MEQINAMSDDQGIMDEPLILDFINFKRNAFKYGPLLEELINSRVYKRADDGSTPPSNDFTKKDLQTSDTDEDTDEELIIKNYCEEVLKSYSEELIKSYKLFPEEKQMLDCLIIQNNSFFKDIKFDEEEEPLELEWLCGKFDEEPRELSELEWLCGKFDEEPLTRELREPAVDIKFNEEPLKRLKREPGVDIKHLEELLNIKLVEELLDIKFDEKLLKREPEKEVLKREPRESSSDNDWDKLEDDFTEDDNDDDSDWVFVPPKKI